MFTLFSLVSALFRGSSKSRTGNSGLAGKRLSMETLESREVLSTVVWSAGTDLPAPTSDVTALVGPDNAIVLLGGNTTSVPKLVTNAASWSSAPAVDKALQSPGAVKTSDGVVLIYGGLSGNQATEETLIYDYYFGDNQNFGNLNVPRANFGAAFDSFDHAYAIGGLDDGNNILATVERYDRGLDLWEDIGTDLPAPRQNAATLIDDSDTIYVFGGQTSTGTSGIANTTFRYDVASGVWDTAAPMPVGTIDSAVVQAANGSIYVLGGRTTAGAIASVQVYDPATDTWSLDTDLPSAVYSEGAAIDSLGRIVVMGGTNAAGADVNSVHWSQRLNVPEVAPIITSLAVVSGTLDGPYSYDVNATGNPQATYALITAPAGMTINANTGLISWQPVVGQTGAQAVTVRAENRVGGVEQSFVINVLGDTTAPTTPTLLTIGSANTTSVSLSWQPSTDNNGVAFYEVLEGYRSGWRGRNTSYRVVQTGITTTSTTITGLVPLTSHKYVVRAVDAAGNKSTNSNQVIASTQSAPILRYFANQTINGTVSALANHPLTIQLTASANPVATFALVSGPAGITVNATTGLLQWTPAPADVGLQNILVQATNSVGTTQLTIPVTVASDVPALSAAFNPTTGGARFAVAGNAFAIQMSDSSNTLSTYELTQAPAGMTIDPNTGLIQWTPTVEDAGQTALTVRATNSAGSTDLPLAFETFFTGPPTNLQVTNLTALHPTLTWSAPTGVGASEVTGYSIVASTRYRYGRYYRTHTVQLDSPGTGTSIELTGLLAGKTYNVKINAYDANGNRGALSTEAVPFISVPALPVIGWTVTNPNGGAIIANQPVVIQLTNYNADPATYSLVSGPAGMTVDPNTGLANWLPSASDVGSFTATFRATNSVGPRDVVVPIHVLFSGPVTNVSAIVVNGNASVSWTAPTDNATPIASYQVTMHWTWSGRQRSRSMIVPGTSTTFALIPTGAVWHRGVTITPIDSLGRAGASTLLVPYIT